MNVESQIDQTRTNYRKIIDHLLKRIEQLEKENRQLTEKLEFHENKGKAIIITEEIDIKNLIAEDEIQSYEEVVLAQNTYRSNHLLNLDCTIKFKDGYKVNL